MNFLYDGNAIEIVNEFTYLGLNFSRTGSFTNAKKVLINKAYKAMYEVLKKGGGYTTCQLNLNTIFLIKL